VQATGSFGAGFGFMGAALCVAAGCALGLAPAAARLRRDVPLALPEA